MVLGQSAASNNVTGSYNTFIGMNAGPTADGINFATAIGYAASVPKSNTIVLGGTGGPAIRQSALGRIPRIPRTSSMCMETST